MRVLTFALVASLLVPATVLGQDRQRVPPEADRSGGGTSSGNSGSGSNTAVPRESAPPPPAAAPAPPPATPAPTRAAPPASSTPGDASPGQAQGRQRVPPEARRDQPQPPGGRAGTAVPRPPNQRPRPGGGPGYGPGSVYHNYYYYYPRYYYPYGYGAFGLGYFYYDPFAWGPAYGYGPPPPFRGYGYGYPTGELRLDVSPRDAEVYVDGYYAGRVDDFDGVFQSLTLEEGTYRIQIASPGYAPLEFDVRIFPGRKATYQGDLLRVRP